MLFLVHCVDTNRQISDNVGYNPAVIAFLVVGIVRKWWIHLFPPFVSDILY